MDIRLSIASIPKMFDAVDTVDAAKPVLSAGPPQFSKSDSSGAPRQQLFDLDVAQTTLLMSALMYERDESIAQQAIKNPDRTDQILRKAERKIHQVARTWGLKFVSINDFPQVSVCFSGAFYPIEGKPFLVLCFKGTSPSSAGEFLIDATFSQEDCGDYLNGTTHQGFYTSLFPAPNSNTADVSPYRQIIDFIAKSSRTLKASLGSNEPVPVWICGHSLGSGLAALLYYRLLKSPRDIGADAVLRDGFLFGNPRTGNSEYVSAFEDLMNDEENARRSLWRITNKKDVVAVVPPGLADTRSNRIALSRLSLLNYAYVTTCTVQLDDKPPYYSFKPERPPQVVAGGPEVPDAEPRSTMLQVGGKVLITPIRVAEFALKTFLPFIWDHVPSNYWIGLNRIPVDDPDLGNQ